MSCCVYRHIGAGMETLYVGLSKDVISRTLSHESNADWFLRVESIEVLHFETRDRAKEVEKELIEKYKPRHNITYLLDHGMHRRERRRAELGAEHDRLRPMVAKAIEEIGEHRLRIKMAISSGTLLRFAFGATVPMHETVATIAKYFDELAPPKGELK